MVHRVLREGRLVTAVAAEFGVDRSTVGKWVARYQREGEAGLRDRSSRPQRSPTRLSGPAEGEIEALRRSRMTGPAIARRLGRPVSTVGAVLGRRGLGRLAALDPIAGGDPPEGCRQRRQGPPALRYERERPGDLVHIDIETLGRIEGVGHRVTGDRRGQSSRRAATRGLGWDCLHVVVDDRSRPPVALPPAPSETDRKEAIAWDWDCPRLGVHRTRALPIPSLASLHDAIDAVLRVHASPGQVLVRGPALRLKPKTALALVMALHELCTNAVKYGAPSGLIGQVSLDWTVAGQGDGRWLLLIWRERSCPVVTLPTQRDFGFRPVGRPLALELRGEVRILFEPEGVTWVIDAPLPPEQAQQFKIVA